MAEVEVETEEDRFASGALDWPAVLALILPFAPSAIGRRALEERQPLGDEEVRRALERARELLVWPADEEPPLDGVPDPVPVLERAETYRATLSGEDLAKVARFVRVVEDVSHWLAGRREDLPGCSLLMVGKPDLAALRAELEGTVDERGNVHPDATPALAALVRERDELARSLEASLREIAQRPNLRGAFADGQHGRTHRRAGRLVLAIKSRHQSRLKGIVHDRSQSGETVFLEPQEVVLTQNQLATVEADVERETNRILSELTRTVQKAREPILDVMVRLAELEISVTAVRYARDVGGRAARLPGEQGATSGLFLRGWRHPLLIQEERAGNIDTVVPIDVRLGDDFDLLVITGPNTGGKTLALKSAGLAVLMTRLGLTLPCEEGSTVPLHDGIVADIGDEQEIQQNLSTFSSHLKRIRAGLDRATGDTLVLLDELGGGTDPAEGAALGEAVLSELLQRGARTLASTHLGKLKEFAFSNARVENAHVEFDLTTLAPSYHLVIGAPGESRALAIARRLGLSEDLVRSAEKRLVKTDGELEELMGEMRDVRLEAERLRAEAAERLEDLEGRERGLEERHEQAKERESQLEAEAQRGLEERLARSRELVAQAKACLSQLPPNQKKEIGAVIDSLETSLGDALLTDRRKAFVEGLKKGDFVWIPRFKKRCQVTRIYKDGRELGVRMGKHEMKVSFDDVTFYESL